MSSSRRSRSRVLFSSARGHDGGKSGTAAASNNDNIASAAVEISPSDHGTSKLTTMRNIFDHHHHLDRYLQKHGIVEPTPIQAHAIPLLRDKNKYDVMASAFTGSGKTLMFLLPLCETVLSREQRQHTMEKKNRPAAIILNPTRELAMQTHAVLRDLLPPSRNSKHQIQTALAVGGMKTSRQTVQNCDVLVGTPGRILQYIDERVLKNINPMFLVVDEADRMLDLGFEPQLKRIAKALNSGARRNTAAIGKSDGTRRQTVLCSATFPPDVQRIAADFLKPDYYFVAAGKVGGMHRYITQTLLWASSRRPHQEQQVVAHVQQFLKENPNKTAIVFCNTKENADRLGSQFPKSVVRVVTGDKTQAQRNESLRLFKDGSNNNKNRVRVLVATDVAARGLHVDHIGLVVQADIPRDVDTFVHRCGRTGRVGDTTGRNVAYFDGRSMGVAADLVELLREAEQAVPAWLLGMSYVSRARRMEEERAILAGGGGIGGVQSSSGESGDDSDTNSRFSTQDFRREAEEGSWGSGRDTTYKSFDEEAYSSLEDPVLLRSEIQEQEVLGIHVREGAENTATSASEHNSKPSSVGERSITPFNRQQPSRALLSQMKRLTGKESIGNKPFRKVLDGLAKCDNQQLRFEYIGMFPFDQVSNLLSFRDRQRRDRLNESDMTRVLMVAEKPSIAKAIADSLCGPGGPKQRRGISRALPVYEFVSDSFPPALNDATGKKKSLVTVTSVVGHVFSLGFVEEQSGETNTFPDPSEYFHLPVVKQEEGSTGKLRVVDHLRALAAEADHLVLWLDCDAEGENIAHEVIGVTRRAFDQKIPKAREESPAVKPIRRIHRARFSAITKDALRDAFRDLAEPDAALSRSVDARQELDLRVGVAMTRLLNWRCVGLARKKFSPSTKVVSYGPCQTPALSFCGDRAKEIEAFRPQKYKKVTTTCSLSGTGETFSPKWIPPSDSSVASSRRGGETENLEDSATFDTELAERIAKMASMKHTKLSISSVTMIQEEKRAPLGLNTVGLLTAASKAMGMSPKTVMNVAEKLYSAGYISYPRTETTRYDPLGFDVRSVLREHQSHPDWGRTASYLLRTKYSKSGRPPLRGHDAGDHPPITSLKAATREEVGGGMAWRVYDFITRNFIGSLSDDLQYTRRVAELQVVGVDEAAWTQSYCPRFQLEQTSVDVLGYAGSCRWVLNDIGVSTKSSGSSDIAFKEGMEFSIIGVQAIDCETKPPFFLQEHELVELMDKERIGTDASLATHINNIVDRGYVVLCDQTGVPLRPPRPPRPGQPRPPRQFGRYLVPTSLGMGILGLFNSWDDVRNEDNLVSLLSRPAIRAQMEAEVKQIASGDVDKDGCLSKNLAWFESRYHEFSSLLSRQRLNGFGHSLCPTQDSLRYWRRLGAFEQLKKSSEDRRRSKGPAFSKGHAKDRKKQKTRQLSMRRRKDLQTPL